MFQRTERTPLEKGVGRGISSFSSKNYAEKHVLFVVKCNNGLKIQQHWKHEFKKVQIFFLANLKKINRTHV